MGGLALLIIALFHCLRGIPAALRALHVTFNARASLDDEIVVVQLAREGASPFCIELQQDFDGTFSHTGSALWRGAVTLAEQLLIADSYADSAVDADSAVAGNGKTHHSPEPILPRLKDKSIVELGCGVGLVALVCAL